MHADAAYAELLRHLREQTLLASCSELLAWDEETCMPPQGVRHRGDQLALLAGIEHDRLTHPRFGELLEVIESSDLVRENDAPAAAIVREFRRRYHRLVRVPRPLVEERTRTISIAQQQ
jgi:carboxypeptidase Taq